MAFVDPRSSPQPPSPQRPLAEDASAITALVQLCREGRIYAVERWIKDGKPLWTSNRAPRVHSPLRVAIDTGQYDLALLLLCNGFPPDTHESLLSHAIYEKATRFIDLLVAWGADPRQVDAYSILQTSDAEMIDRFWSLGVDVTEVHALARELARSSSRPLYGWAKRHQDDSRVARELAIALADSIINDRERAIALLLWAGANPHARVPSLQYNDEDYPEDHTSAIECAITYGKGKLLSKLKPDPAVDNFEKLWAAVCDVESITYLGKIQHPQDWSRSILRNMHRITWDYGDRWEPRTCIEKLASMGARLTTMTAGEIKDMRRAMLRCKNEYPIRWLLQWMKNEAHCAAAIYHELTRTSGMQRLVTR